MKPFVRRTRHPVVAGSLIASVLIAAPFAAAGTGDNLREGVRNGTAVKETEIIGNMKANPAGKGGFVTRQSNVSEGAGAGGGAVYGCRTPVGGTSAGSAPCLRGSNLKAGNAFEFATKNGPKVGEITIGDPAVANPGAPFTTNANGLATGLNADRVDNLHAAQIIAAARAKAGLDAQTADSAANADNLGGKSPDQVAMWAVIEDDGTLVRGSGASNAARNAAGEYRVTFTQNLLGCAIQGTVTRTGDTGVIPDPGSVVTGLQFTPKTRAFVHTFDSAGAASDRPVAVTVTC